MVQLRDYQERGIREIRSALREGHRAVLFQLPTGGGKTLLAGWMLGEAAERGHTSMFICNRVELLDQTGRAFDKLGVRYGVIAAGRSPSLAPMTQIASIDTLKSRLRRGTSLRPPKIIVWDECRGLGAKGWTEIFRAFPDAVHIGLDATPIRLDGKGLGLYFTHLVRGPTYKELLAFGALVPILVYAPSAPDMTGVRTKRGDFDKGATEEIMNSSALVGDVITHYQKLAPGRQGITFGVSIKHSEHLAALYRDAGIPAAHVDGETDKGERKRIIQAFRRRELRILCNVDLFTAGFDVPGVEVITMARPTQSLAIYLQQVGRGSRPGDDPAFEKKDCILIDHAGNALRHGLPDEDRDWTLDGLVKKKGKKAADDPLSVKQCPACYAVFEPAPACPYCGHQLIAQGRDLEVVEGELRRLTPEDMAMIKQQRRIEVARAQSLEELQRIGEERGYSPNWADHVWNAKKGKRDARRGGARRFDFFA